MTLGEARRALGEMTAKLDPKHLREVEAKLDEAERAAGAAVAATPSNP